MNRVLQAALRTELSFFIRKVFATVSPGESLPAQLAHRRDRAPADAGASGSNASTVDQSATTIAEVDLHLGRLCRLDARSRSHSSFHRRELFRRFRRRAPSAVPAGRKVGLVRRALPRDEMGKGNRAGVCYDPGRGPICDLVRRNADRARRRRDCHRRSAQRHRGPIGARPEEVIDWYSGTLVSRLNDKRTGAIIAVMQRLHEDDLAGHLLRQGGWDHLDMPAIALDEDVDLGHGKTHLRVIGDVLHPEREGPSGAGQDQEGNRRPALLRPVPGRGLCLWRATSSDALGFAISSRAHCPLPSTPSKIVQSWDVAMMTGDHNDYSVCTTWLADKDDVYLLEVFAPG